MRYFFALFALLVAGCANNSHDECGDKFVLLWPTASKEYKFQVVQFSTLKSPYELKGSAAEIFFEGRVTDSGYEGSVARPRLTRSGGGVCVPMDTGSSMALAAYGHFEALQKFDRAMGVENQLSWPRKVGVEIHMRSVDGQNHNNAHYFSKADAVAVIPYSADGVAMGLNPGVLAHEHFHAHFQSQVINPLNDAVEIMTSVENLFYDVLSLKPIIEDVDGANIRTVEGLNRFVMRSWNEGLADFYGAVFSDQPDFFSPSLKKVALARDLRGPLYIFKTGDQLASESAVVLPHLMNRHKRNMVGMTYQQGTLLARLLYQIATSGAIEPKDLLKSVLLRLNKIPSVVSSQFNRRVLDFEEVVPVILQGVPINSFGCQALKSTLSKPALLRSFRSCGL